MTDKAATQSKEKQVSEVLEKPSAVEVPKPVTPQPIPRKVARNSWFLSALPYNMALGPLSTFVQLAIIEYYGQTTGTVYVGLIITAFNGVTIPASMFWGFATDRFHRRKPIIILSFVLIAADFIGLLFTKTAYGIGALYSLFSLFSAASSTPFNLLIMETQPKSSWASAFARFSMISTIGNTLGLVLGAVWVTFLPFEWLVLPLSLLSLISAILAATLIDEPSFVFEREMIVLAKPSFLTRLLELPTLFLRIPRASDFRRVFKGLRFELTSYIPILYLSIVAFNISSGIFNTSIVTSMTFKGLTQSEIYAVTFVVLVVQVFSFRYAAPYIAKRTLVKTAFAGLALRSICYASMGISVFLMSGLWYIVPSFIFYPLSSGFAYAIYYTSSSTLVFNSLGSKGQGSSLGVYSALVGVATMIGSLISGYTSAYLGFHVTFLLAGACLGLSAGLIWMLSHIGDFKK